MVRHSGFVAVNLKKHPFMVGRTIYSIEAVSVYQVSIPFPLPIVPYRSFSFPLFVHALAIACNRKNHGFLLYHCQRIPCKYFIDCQSSISSVSPSFSSPIKLWPRQTGLPIAVTTTSGGFTCLVNLVPDIVDADYDVKLGRDWFNYCTTTVPGAQILLSDDKCLVFSSSPFFAMRARSCEFLIL